MALVPDTSKNMKLFQKHVKVCVPNHAKCKRDFRFTEFGNQTFAILAASVFEKEISNVCTSWELYKRKPMLRQGLLESYGFSLGAGTSRRKSLDDQLESFLTYLCDGSSSKLNGIIVDKVCGTFHDAALLSKSSVKWEPTGFITSYQGSKQKVEQTFKSLKAASDWAGRTEQCREGLSSVDAANVFFKSKHV